MVEGSGITRGVRGLSGRGLVYFDVLLDSCFRCVVI